MDDTNQISNLLLSIYFLNSALSSVLRFTLSDSSQLIVKPNSFLHHKLDLKYAKTITIPTLSLQLISELISEVNKLSEFVLEIHPCQSPKSDAITSRYHFEPCCIQILNLPQSNTLSKTRFWFYFIISFKARQLMNSRKLNWEWK